jgi:hypothetical protein
MNAYRFAVEQRKKIATFRGDGIKDTSGNDAIGIEKKVPVTVFPNDTALPEIWEQWLLGLSSLI